MSGVFQPGKVQTFCRELCTGTILLHIKGSNVYVPFEWACGFEIMVGEKRIIYSEARLRVYPDNGLEVVCQTEWGNAGRQAIRWSTLDQFLRAEKAFKRRHPPKTLHRTSQQIERARRRTESERLRQEFKELRQR